jgi:soluble lytic murein transglycosylase
MRPALGPRPWKSRRALFALGAVVCACRSGSPPEARPPARPSSGPGAREQVAGGGGKGENGKEPGIDFGMPRISPALDDPRLAAAREREQLGDESGAASEVDRVRRSVVLDAAQACAWGYVAGRLHLAAGEAGEAALAFERAEFGAGDAGTACPLAMHARLRQAQALVRLGHYDDAIAIAHGLGDELNARDETKLVLSDAFVGKGNRAAAVPIWRDLLASSPHGVRWVDTSIELATALLDGVDGPPGSRADEALDVVTRALIEAPALADKLDAAALRVRATVASKRGATPAPSPEDRARQAQAWFDSSQPKHAREAAEDVLKAIPRGDKNHHEASCKAAILRAQATAHGKSNEAADAWGDAIVRCERDDLLVTALYYGGKASSAAKRNAEALARYGRVEKLFPKHRLADDARLRAALVLQDQGEDTRALAMLASLPDVYPEGDMRSEALFRLSLAKLGVRDLDGARTALDRLLAIAPDPPGHSMGSALAGRADYFRARVAQLAGDVDDARRRYAALVVDQPLAYYMLLAYARLRAIDDGLARATLQAAVAREAPGPFLTSDHVEFALPAFDRFARLLEVGEFEGARHAASSGGLLAEGVDPEVLWTIAWLYDRAGAPETGHAFARSRLVEYRAHWPAGRWRLAWEVAFPRAWDAMVARESESSHIPAPLTWAVMREESAFMPDARSAANAIGLMQLIGGTARKVASGTPLPFDEQALQRPQVSIALGTRLLSSLRGSFPGVPALAIAAYNGGPAAVRRWLSDHGADDFDVFVERIPFDETRTYIKRVLASEAAYAFLYAPAALDELLALPARAAGQAVAESGH